MVPNAPNMLQNMARYTFHMQRPRNLLFGDLQQTVLLLLSNICLHCGEYSARSCKHRRRRGWWWVSKAAPQAPDSLVFSAPRSAREDAEMLESEPCNTQVCGGQRQLTTHAQDHTKIIAHSCGDHSCGHAEYNCAATSSVMTIEFRQLRHVYL